MPSPGKAVRTDQAAYLEGETTVSTRPLAVRAALTGALAAGALVLLAAGPEAGRPQAPSLQLVFGGSAGSGLEVKAGTFTVAAAAKDAPAGRPVLTADKGPVVLEGRAAQAGA